MKQLVDPQMIRENVKSGSSWASACGQRMQSQREALGLSRADLSTLIDVPIQTVHRIERGEIVPRDYLRLAIAQALATTVDRLYPWPSKSEVAEWSEVAA